MHLKSFTKKNYNLRIIRGSITLCEFLTLSITQMECTLLDVCHIS